MALSHIGFVRFHRLHPQGKLGKASSEEFHVRHRLRKIRGIDQLNHTLPVGSAQSDGQPGIEARNRIAG